MGQMNEASLMKSSVVRDPLREHSFTAISYQWTWKLFSETTLNIKYRAEYLPYIYHLQYFSVVTHIFCFKLAYNHLAF